MTTLAEQLLATRALLDCTWSELARQMSGLGLADYSANKLCRWAGGRVPLDDVQDNVAVILGAVELLNKVVLEERNAKSDTGRTGRPEQPEADE